MRRGTREVGTRSPNPYQSWQPRSLPLWDRESRTESWGVSVLSRVWVFEESLFSIVRVSDLSIFQVPALFLYYVFGDLTRRFRLSTGIAVYSGWKRGLNSSPGWGKESHREPGPSRQEVGTRSPVPYQSWTVKLPPPTWIGIENWIRNCFCSLDGSNFRTVVVFDWSCARLLVF